MEFFCRRLNDGVFAVAPKEKEPEGKFYEIMVGSGTIYLDEAGLKAAEQKLRKSIGPTIARMVKLNASYQNEITEYYRAADV